MECLLKNTTPQKLKLYTKNQDIFSVLNNNEKSEILVSLRSNITFAFWKIIGTRIKIAVQLEMRKSNYVSILYLNKYKLE